MMNTKKLILCFSLFLMNLLTASAMSLVEPSDTRWAINDKKSEEQFKKLLSILIKEVHESEELNPHHQSWLEHEIIDSGRDFGRRVELMLEVLVPLLEKSSRSYKSKYCALEMSRINILLKKIGHNDPLIRLSSSITTPQELLYGGEEVFNPHVANKVDYTKVYNAIDALVVNPKNLASVFSRWSLSERAHNLYIGRKVGVNYNAALRYPFFCAFSPSSTAPNLMIRRIILEGILLKANSERLKEGKSPLLDLTSKPATNTSSTSSSNSCSSGSYTGTNEAVGRWASSNCKCGHTISYVRQGVYTAYCK